ncbi:MAG TPA: FliH/SctL family protein [Kofleriaceae bacterium]|jgi:flagellar assembly protein FliH
MSARPLFAALADERAAGIAPWSPRVVDAIDGVPAPGSPRATAGSWLAPIAAPIAAIAPSAAVDFAADRDAARVAGHAAGLAEGRAEGLRETDALRARLAALVEAVTAANANATASIGELATEIAITAVEAWAAHADHSAALRTAIADWIAASPTEPAAVRANPAEVELVTAAAGSSPLSISADSTLARGELAITSATRELQRSIASRLGELRAAIAEALATERA